MIVILQMLCRTHFFPSLEEGIMLVVSLQQSRLDSHSQQIFHTALATKNLSLSSSLTVPGCQDI